jgi:signal transduction histidine kinase
VQGNKHETEFVVSDNGMGIDLEKNKKYLFQPFKRICEEEQGTGIGLFMIKRMVEKYGGKIDLESKPDVGTTFRFTLMSVSMASDFVKQKQNSFTTESMLPDK